MRNRNRFFSILLLTVTVVLQAHASRQDDSLSVNVDGAASAAQRAKALLSIASAHARSQPGESLVQLRTAVAYAERSGDKAILLKALRQQRDLQREAGAFDEFLSTAVRVLDISERGHDDHNTADDLRCLAEAYERIGAYDKAVDVQKRALFLLKTTGDSSAISASLLDLMNTLIRAGRFTDVLHQSEEALEYYERRNDTTGQANVWLREGEALVAQQRFASAIPLLARARRVLRDPEQRSSLARTFMALSEANVGLGYWPQAQQQLDSARELSAAASVEAQPRIYALQAWIAEGTGDLAGALTNLKRYHVMRDSLFDQRMAERMAGLQALYQNDKRDRDLADLRAKSEFSEEQMHTAQARNKWWILLIVVLASLTAVLLLFFRQLRRALRRVKLKNQVIRRQADEIKAKNMDLERQNLRLADSLVMEEEKDVLLKEIHHRVKNNLQIVNTLLKLQGAFPENRSMEEVLSDCQGRVRSMAMVHEHIYKCGDLSRVNVRSHLMALCSSVLRNYQLDERVTLDLQVNYDRATLDNLIPLSLLINELVTNSAKHAFDGRGNGRITIVLRRMGATECELVYNDDGTGMELARFYNTESFGLELIRTLASQLNGTIRLLKGEGTTFQLTFTPEERVLRKAS